MVLLLAHRRDVTTAYAPRCAALRCGKRPQGRQLERRAYDRHPVAQRCAPERAGDRRRDQLGPNPSLPGVTIRRLATCVGDVCWRRVLATCVGHVCWRRVGDVESASRAVASASRWESRRSKRHFLRSAGRDPTRDGQEPFEAAVACRSRAGRTAEWVRRRFVAGVCLRPLLVQYPLPCNAS
jgi:hypothetical protein